MNSRRRWLAGRSLAAVGSLLALALAASSSAQGLGSAAAAERERRESSTTPPARVLTNDDLPSPPEDETATEGGSDPAETAPVLPVELVDPEQERLEREREELDRERERRALAEQEWRARVAEARARVREAEERCWQEVVRTEFHKGIPVQMKVREFVETEEYRQAQRSLAELQEEFRRTGLPPGWAREPESPPSGADPPG
jgi:type IV secretory pathway VirB10-like protein